MIRKRYFAIAGAALLLIVVVATILSRPSGVTTKGADGGSSPATASAAVYSTASYDQIDTGSLSREQISAELNRRDATDSKWEWKVPIQFFGRVVDENDRPIADAEVDVQWTDLTSRGTSERRLFSGANGSFEIHDITGKRLIVRVENPVMPSRQARLHAALSLLTRLRTFTTDRTILTQSPSSCED